MIWISTTVVVAHEIMKSVMKSFLEIVGGRKVKTFDERNAATWQSGEVKIPPTD